MTDNANNKPVKQFRIGAVSVSVWKQEARGKTFNVASIDRSYRDKDGNWRRTNTFDLANLAAVKRLVNRAEACIDKLSAA